MESWLGTGPGLRLQRWTEHNPYSWEVSGMVRAMQAGSGNLTLHFDSIICKMRRPDEVIPKLSFYLTMNDFILNSAKRSGHLLIISKAFKFYHLITTCAKWYCGWSIRSIFGGLWVHIIWTGLLECVGSSSLLQYKISHGKGKTQKTKTIVF